MNQPEDLFYTIEDEQCRDPEVQLGKMKSAPRLKFENKVFAFFSKDSMGFRLGNNFDPNKFGIRNAKLLNPLKKKPPLKGWYIHEYDESDYWKMLT